MIIEGLRLRGVRALAACRDVSRLPPGTADARVGDLRDPAYRRTLFEGVDVVCIASAWSSLYGHADESRRLFFEPTRDVLHDAVQQGVGRVVFTSSLDIRKIETSRHRQVRTGVHRVWPHLANIIALEQEMRALASPKTQMVSLRFPAFVGAESNLGLLPVLLPRLGAHLVPWIDQGRAPLPLIAGPDIGAAFAAASLADGLSPWQAFDVVGPQSPTFRELLGLVHEEFGYPLPHFSVSHRSAFLFAQLAEAFSALTPFDPLLTRSIVFLAEPYAELPAPGVPELGFTPSVDWREAVRAQVGEIRRHRKKSRLADLRAPALLATGREHSHAQP